jgi:competence protein ComEA
MAEHVERVGNDVSKQALKKIDLNSASKEELLELQGINDKQVEKIIQYREEHGGFASVEDLKSVEGFSDVLLQGFQDRLIVGERQTRH